MDIHEQSCSCTYTDDVDDAHIHDVDDDNDYNNNSKSYIAVRHLRYLHSAVHSHMIYTNA